MFSYKNIKYQVFKDSEIHILDIFDLKKSKVYPGYATYTGNSDIF